MPRSLTRDRLLSLLDTASRRRVAVIGDAMLDVYLRGDVDRISPEAPVPVVRVRDRRYALGGAANVAQNVRAVGAAVDLIAAIGDDAGGRQLCAMLGAIDADLASLVTVERPTTTKTRIVARSQQVVRVDEEEDADLAGDEVDKLLSVVRRSVAEADALVFEDYNKGVLVPRVIEAAMDSARGRRIPVIVDPKYRNFYPADNYPGPLDYAGDTNRLYHNNCNGTFTDVTDKSGIGAYKGRTMGATAADYDGDGYPDIYVSNDKTENFLFHNKHDGTFQEVAGDLGVAYGQNGESTSAMGPVFADVDGDGRLDLFVTDSKYNRLMRNAGANGFEDIGPASGISQANAQYTSWGSGVYDFDNDGALDIMIFHGGLVHLVPQEHSLFRGLGNGKFVDVSREAGTVLETKTVSRGACFADYDNDGKVDAFVVNLGAPATLLRNITQNSNHWLTVKLKGKKSNRDGIGAHLELLSGGRKQVAERPAGSGYLSQDDGRIHFGLGTAPKVERLTIRWPSGQEQILENPAVDRVLTMEEP